MRLVNRGWDGLEHVWTISLGEILHGHRADMLVFEFEDIKALKQMPNEHLGSWLKHLLQCLH